MEVPAPKTQEAPVLAAPKEALVKDQRYVKVIRGLLTKHGCDAGSCHGTFKGGGLYFSSGGNPENLRDYESVLERIDRKNPKESILLKKALGQVEHNGGRNLADGECDTRRIIAWISDAPDIDCPEPPPPQSKERFAREVLPALRHLGCAEGACHGAQSPGTKLDLSGDGAYRSFMATPQNRIVAWMSPVLRAAWGEDEHHKKPVDLRSCAYRRLHGFVAGAPEQTCDVGSPLAKMPSYDDFEKIVLPGVVKRGCFDGSCHGGGAGGMALFEWQRDIHAAPHNYLMLTSRLEDPKKLAESTLLRTARNVDPHGGGKRLGGPGDCLDDLVVKWAEGKKVKACPPPKPPSFERFVTEVQPVLDKMTCTQAACHGENIPSFKMVKGPTDKAQQLANYQSVIKQIDYDFMPLSAVQLRMREPCAYSVVGAWIEGRQKPVCVVHDPDPAIFPKRDKRGNVVHPKVDPGPPAPAAPI